MRKTNHVPRAAHGERGTKHSARGPQRGPAAKRANGLLREVDTLTMHIAPRGAGIKQGAMAGAAVLAATTAFTASYFGRRRIAKSAAGATKQIGKWGMALAIAAGLRKKPFYMRPLPGIGMAASMLAAGSAAILLFPRMRGGGRREKMQSMGPGSELHEMDAGFSDRSFGARSYNEHR